MDAFEDSFSFRAIVRVLATLRAKEANLRHRKVFFWRYFGGEKDPGQLVFSEVGGLLPPRRQWARPNRKMRGGKGRPLTEILRDAIYRKVQGVAAVGRLTEFEWGRRLQAFVAEVQDRVGRNDFAFENPRLRLRPKAVPIDGKTKCRCVCCYEKLSDRVILSVANKWFANVVDPTLLDCCYSFRSTRKLTYNTAVKNLVVYRKAHAGRIYVADCDVMKFYDTVSHAIVRDVVARRLEDVEGREQFLRLLDGYLASYNLEWMLKNANNIAAAKTGCILDVVDTGRMSQVFGGGAVDQSHIGIPQGGALSGTLANLVLDSVDHAVMSASVDDLFYARYCDDVLIVHPHKKECAKALAVCMDALRERCIPAHPLWRNVRYGADYYKGKSKGPYAWMRQSAAASYAIPWVSFLGCCVRYDGELRLRKETIEGHAESMREECASFLNRAEGRSVGDDAVAGLMYRLVDKGVGRITAQTARGLGRCWMSAFPHVWKSNLAIAQLRHLDHIRAGLLSQVKRKLGLSLKKANPELEEESSLYFGKPFSYAGIAERISRAGVAANRKLLFELSGGASPDGQNSTETNILKDNDDLIEDEPYPPYPDWGRASMGR